jgi:hypothetical protein
LTQALDGRYSLGRIADPSLQVPWLLKGDKVDRELRVYALDEAAQAAESTLRSEFGLIRASEFTPDEFKDKVAEIARAHNLVAVGARTSDDHPDPLSQTIDVAFKRSRAS